MIDVVGVEIFGSKAGVGLSQDPHFSNFVPHILSILTLLIITTNKLEKLKRSFFKRTFFHFNLAN